MTYRVRGNTVVDSVRNARFTSANVVGSLASVSTSRGFQGAVSGFTTGGLQVTPPSVGTNTIDKFPFATDANATDVGDLVVITYSGSGQSSSTSGYSSGGLAPPSAIQGVNNIQKFPLISNSDASDVGDLSTLRYNIWGGNSSSRDGYSAGGGSPPPGSFVTNILDKFPFATDSNAVQIGTLATGVTQTAGISSAYNGYLVSRATGTGEIQKFPFATDASAVMAIDQNIPSTNNIAGQNSAIAGYYTGMFPVPAFGFIAKFPFATEATAVQVARLSPQIPSPPNNPYQNGTTGQSSTVSGYQVGGGGFASFVTLNIIEKFPFATDANATDVGDLTQPRYQSTGQQY